MTLKDLIDEATRNDIDPANIIICDYNTLDQFEYYQSVSAKIQGNTAELMFLSVEDMLLTEAVAMATLARISMADNT